MQSVKVSDSHPPDAWDQQARSLLAPGVCDLFVPLFSRWVPCFIYLRPPQTNPPPPLPPHPFFSKTDTGSEFKIDTRCKCHFPAWLSLRQLSPPTPANQNPEASHVWVALSPVHTGRGGWSPPSAVSPPLVSAASLPPQPLPHPFPVDLGSFCLFFHWCSQGRSWLPALPPRVLSVAIFCHFRSLLLHCVLEHLVELVMQEKHRLNLNALPSSSQWISAPLLYHRLYQSVHSCSLSIYCIWVSVLAVSSPSVVPCWGGERELMQFHLLHLFRCWLSSLNGMN